MIQELSSNRYLEYANRLFEDLDTKEINLAYIGCVTQEVTCNFTTMTEDNLQRHEEKTAVQRKVFYVMVESLQNISRHADKLTDNPMELRKGVVVICHSDTAYNVVTGNLIKADKCQKLQDKLDGINALTREQLVEAYKKQITEGEISESGGAGLGYIDMSKKSGNKIGYRFFDIEELPDYKFFMAYATINRQL